MMEHGPIPEAELVDLFRPRRPDPEAFRAGVERRIAEKRAAAERGEEEQGHEPLRSVFLRRVAALLPADPLTGAAAGSAAGKWAGVKLLPTALALPALVLGTAIGGFLAGLRSLRRSAGQAVPQAEFRHRREGLRQHWILGLLQLSAPLIVLLPVIVGPVGMVDLLVGLLLASMLGLALSARSLAGAGMLSRSTIADVGTGTLLVLIGSVFLWATIGTGRTVSHAELGTGGSLLVLLLGVLGCRLLAPRDGETGMKGAALMIFLVHVLAVLLIVNPFGSTRTSPDSLRAQLAGFELDCTDLKAWQEAGALYQAMIEVGIEPPDLTPVAREVERALDPELSVHPAVWTTAADMGLLSPEQWERLAGRKAEAQFLDRLVEYRPGDFLPMQSWQRYWIPMLLATREPSLEQRTSVALAVGSNWPVLGSHGAPEKAWMVVQLLEGLGETQRIEALRPRAHELLQRYWMPPGATGRFGKPGGFTSNPEKFRTSFDDSTLAAVNLMARLGVPPGIDLLLLRSHLRNEARADTFFTDREDYLKAFERAALVVLEGRIELPRRSPLQRVLDERVLLATILIVVLCLAAIALVPRAGALGGGALP